MAESMISRARAIQLELIAELDRAQIATADGCRTMTDWVSARLDINADLARQLVSLAKSIEPAAAQALTDGEATFDRAVAVTKLAAAGVENAYERSLGHDLAGVSRWAARHRRMTRADEREAFESRYLVMQPNLDESNWRLWGQLSGIDGRVVEKALTERADQFPEVDPRPSLAQRQADALSAICADSLEAKGITGEVGPQITVFVDAKLALPSGLESGITIDGGLRIGPSALTEALCGGKIEALTRIHGELHRIGTGGRVIPPATRRFVMARDGGCVIDGCQSRYRLQVHHIIERGHGGSHNPQNLATLCWYHHHVAVHGAGMVIDPKSPPQRRRLLRPARDPPG